MRTYSHPATRQDDWLREVFPDLTSGGTALEIGGYDGITHSNTLLLEKLGWECTLIEAVPEFYQRMVKNRPGARCIEAAVTGDTHHDCLAMLVNGQYSGLQITMSSECLAGHRSRKSTLLGVFPKRIFNIVSERHFDYISLDTEGGEELILKDWFDCGGTCSALSVEFNYDGQKFDRLKHLCAENKMNLDRVQGFDMFFLRRFDV